MAKFEVVLSFVKLLANKSVLLSISDKMNSLYFIRHSHIAFFVS